MIHLISSFILEHPGAVSPPDIQIFKAFLEYVGVYIISRTKTRPTVSTVNGWQHNLQSSLERRRDFLTPENIQTTIRQVRRINILPWYWSILYSNSLRYVGDCLNPDRGPPIDVFFPSRASEVHRAIMARSCKQGNVRLSQLGPKRLFSPTRFTAVAIQE
jgi:hypothetical protein